MPEQRLYLDTSALVKRYVREEGTEIIDGLFKSAEMGDAVLYSSRWSIGEAIGVFDRYDRRKVIRLANVLDKFLNEIKRLSAKGSFRIIDVSSELVSESIENVVKHHIYVADALQIATCKSAGCDRFFTSDRALGKVAKMEKITTVTIGVG